MFLQLNAIGNLGNDPEMRYTPAGKPVTSFSLACNRQYTGSDGEQHKEVIWLRCEAWGKTAEVVNQYLKKGRQVFVQGRLKGDANGNPRVWTRNDGTPAASFEVTIETVKFLGGPSDHGTAPSGEAAPEATEEESIPF